MWKSQRWSCWTTKSLEFFGNLYSKERKIFNIKYSEFIAETANHLKLIGVNLNTAPVLDLRLKGSSSIIGDRSFSHDPKVVSRIGDICIENFHKNKIGTIMKHIPGHGLAKVDSHKLTPTIKQNLKYYLSALLGLPKDCRWLIRLVA